MDPSKNLDDPAALLAKLVAYRTDVEFGDERPLVAWLGELLRERRADEVVVGDVPRLDGKPAAFVYARFGRPRLLVNAHVDTVPPNTGYTSDPFVARVVDERLYGLGAADTKGAIAAIVCALDEVTPTDTGILFSGDEEYSGVVMNAFVAGPHRAGLERAIVCEPTSLRVGTRHRGFYALEVEVRGPGGHSSRADEVLAPLAVAARIAARFDDWGKARKAVGPPGFPGMCLNVANFDGGIAFNVIPSRGRLLVSLRPPPGADASAICAELEALAREIEPSAAVRVLRANVPLATRSPSAFERLVGEAARAPIDLAFWTEAALLAASGVDAIVLGPGDIAQAHAPDEWVCVDELRRARDLFRTVFERTRREGIDRA